MMAINGNAGLNGRAGTEVARIDRESVAHEVGAGNVQRPLPRVPRRGRPVTARRKAPGGAATENCGEAGV